MTATLINWDDLLTGGEPAFRRALSAVEAGYLGLSYRLDLKTETDAELLAQTKKLALAVLHLTEVTTANVKLIQQCAFDTASLAARLETVESQFISYGLSGEES